MEKRTLAELFQRHADDVFRLAYSYLGRRTDAEDICQSVFLKLVESRKWPDEGKEKSWLLTCTANACKSHLHNFWNRNVGPLDEALPFQDKEDRELHRAVTALPIKYRVVIHLYYFEGYDQGEISAILHISRTAVQTRMSRARALLRKELSEDEVTI